VARGPKPRAQVDWILWALLVLALVMRFWGVQHRLPDPTLGVNVLDDSAIEETDRTTMGRAWTMWGGGTRALDLNPHTGGWPALSFYVTLVMQLCFRVYHLLVVGGGSAAEFTSYVSNHSDRFFLFARSVSALVGALTVWLTYRLARRHFGRTAGLAAGLLLALNPLHILTSQHIADPNLLAMLFVLLATFALTRVAEGGTVRDSIEAGALIGLAGACKYVPLVLVIPYLVAHGAVGQAEKRRTWATGWLAGLPGRRAVWLGLLAILAAVFIASPFLFLDWQRTVHDFGVQRRSLFSDWVGQTEFPISLPTYLAVSLPHALGWPAYLLSLAGLLLIFRAGRRGVVLGLIPVTMLLANGMLKAAQERYVLPAVPFLLIAAALAFERGLAWLRRRVPSRAIAMPAAAMAGLLAIGWSVPEFLSARRELALPDSRHAARGWINANIDRSAGLAVELYGPVFQKGERQFVIWPFFATQAPLTRVAYHPEFLDGLDLICLSGEISRRFESEAAKYPVETAYYRWLSEHSQLLWRSDSTGMSGPRLEVRALPHGISTRARRDSLAIAEIPRPTETPRVALWCLDMAKLFLERGENDRAEEWARRGFRPGAPALESGLWTALAAAEYRQGHPDRAEEAARKALVLLPKNALLHFQRGLALHQLNRFEEALAEYRAAQALSPDPRFHVNAASALGSLGRYPEALAELDEVPPGHFTRAMALHSKAMILGGVLHRPAEALAALKESLELDPKQDGADEMRREVARLEAAIK
jgi:tetratricopeptide (TPR) repeat protein